MPPPHKHPSVHCYKTHRCRCPECKHLAMEWQREHRRAHGRAKGTAAATRRKAPLSDEEVARIRRSLGISSD